MSTLPLWVTTTSHNTRSSRNISLFHFKHNFFKNYFFSFCKKWMEQSRQIYSKFRILKKSISKFIRPSPNSTYNCFNTKGIKHLARLRLGLSDLRDHKFKHGFLDSLNPVCSCGFDIETTCHFLFLCPNFINESHFS